MEKIISRNPATGETLGELTTTPPDVLSTMFDRAHTAQAQWSVLSPKKRANLVLSIRETIINQVDGIATSIAKETGKPRFEAMTNEVLPAVNLITYFAKRAPRLLKDRRIPLSHLPHRTSYLNYWPLGTVAVITPWNHPFFLPLGEIILAILAGNAVIFKPSEETPLTGLKIQEIFEEAGAPLGLIQTAIGDGKIGQEIIKRRPAKVFFTGSADTGRRVAMQAAEHLIPVCLELGGKNAMIVLRDADLDYATSAALWGCFSGSGQVCGSVERIVIHESIAEEFVRRLSDKISKLRQDNPEHDDVDLGVITTDRQKIVYERQINQARTSGATFTTGGEFSADKRVLKPTIITGPQVENLEIFNEETFGPAVTITTFKSLTEAVKKTNSSRYGLMASIITRNFVMGEQLARQLEVGTVTINEVAYTAALPETPWGGLKESGYGRKHSDIGLYEFTNLRHIHKPVSRLFVFKSPWWFPYSSYQYATFRGVFDLFKRHWTDKLLAFPLFLWNLVQFIKREKRI